MARFIVQMDVAESLFTSACMYIPDNTFSSALADDLVEKWQLSMSVIAIPDPAAQRVTHALRISFSTRREFAKLPHILDWARRTGYTLKMYPVGIADHYHESIKLFDAEVALRAACWYKRGESS